MARIPVTSARRSLDPGSPVSYPDSLGTGEAISGFGRDIANAGQSISSSMQGVEEAARRQREGIENFEAEQKFIQAKIATANKLPEIQSQVPASGAGFHDNVLTTFDENAQKLLSSVPERLKPKMQALIETERMSLSGKAAGTELEQRYGWYRSGITKAVETGQEQVFNDPAALDAARDEAIRAIEASGLPQAEIDEWKEKARQGIAASLATRLMQDDPTGLVGMLGVAPPPSTLSSLTRAQIGVESSGNPNAVSSAGAAGLMQVMPATGAEIAQEIGDPDFPLSGSDADKREYLKREDVSIRYGEHYREKMLARFGGDVPAALIAYNGGPARAERWLAAGRDDSVIPKESADYYKKVMGAAAPEGNLPIQAKSHVDLDGVKPIVLNRFEALQNQWGRPLPINSGHRDKVYNKRAGGADKSQHIHGNALDVDVSSYSKEERQQLIAMASAMGFTGIGVYNNALHFDMGDRRAWGPTYKGDSVPGWAKDAIGAHLAGKADKLVQGGVSAPGYTLDPRFADLPFSERLKMSGMAQKAAADQAKTFAAQQDARYKAYTDASELRALTGGYSTELEILDDPMLLDADKSSLLRTFRSQQEEASKTDLAIQEYLAGGQMNWNPLDGTDTGMANKVHTALTEKVEPGSPQAQAVTDDFIRRTSIIPSSVAADLRRGGFSEDPAELAAAMGEADRISRIAPESFQTMPSGGDLQKDMASFQHLVRDRGFSAEDAARRLIERRSPEYRVNEDVLGPLADKAVRDLEVSDVTDAFDEGLFSSEPGAGADVTTQNALLAEYREAFREEFIRVGGDEDEAKARAAKELSRTWGVSKVSGDKQLMKFPPEKFYPAIGSEHAYLTADMTATAAEYAGAEIGRAMLRPDAATSADVRAGRPPRYRLFYEREVDGQTIIDQVPGYWAMPADRIQSLSQTARANDSAMRRAEALRQTYDAAAEGGRTAEGVDAVMPTIDLITGQYQRLQSLNPFGGAQAAGRGVAGGKQGRLTVPAMPGSRDAIRDGLNRQREELLRNAPR